MAPLKYLQGDPEATLAQVRQLQQQHKVADWLMQKYPQAHTVRTDRALYDYVQDLRLEYLRGADPVNVDALAELLGRVGVLADEQPDIAELDLNPVCVSIRSALVLDAWIRVAPSPIHEEARRLR